MLDKVTPIRTATHLVAICVHCGAAVPRGVDSQFCCRGCETVFSLIQSSGLGQYYGLRRRLNIESAPIPPSTLESYAYLDDPEFVAAYAEENGRRMRFYLEGVHCAACVWLTERLPALDPEIARVELNLSSGIATVDLLARGTFARAAENFARLGYRPHPVETREADARERTESRRLLLRIGVAAACSANLMIFAVSIYAGADDRFAPLFRWLSLGLFLPVLLYSARPFFEAAYQSIRLRRPAIDVPIVFGILSGTAASIYGLFDGRGEIYFDSLAGLVFLLLSSRYLLARVQAKAVDASRLLHFLAPSRARRMAADGTILEVRSDALVVGDRIEIIPGSVSPADGVVLSGRGGVSRSWMTGEARIETVDVGDRILAGSLNENAVLVIRVTASGSATRLGEILIEMEAEAAARPEIARFVDRVARYFVPFTFVLIAIGFALGARIGLAEGVSRAIAVAVVVCPCALAMAVPLAMSLSIGRLAKRGILVRGADVLERLSRVEIVFFDKTGTLTTGKLTVKSWLPLLAGRESILLGLEAKSQHPIARAIRAHFGAAGSLAAAVSDVQETLGVGVTGWFAGKHYSLRSSELVGSDTEVTLYEDGTAVGRVLLVDPIRPGADVAVTELRARGINVGILSGDNAPSVRNVAAHLGLKPVSTRSSLTPEAKAELLRRYPNSMMVGDGANDAIALAAATVGMAVQGGMEVARRAAGIYGAANDPRDVVRVVDLARGTMKIIRLCLGFTLIYNAVVVSFALSGHMRPLVAAILMPASAFTVFALVVLGTRRNP